MTEQIADQVARLQAQGSWVPRAESEALRARLEAVLALHRPVRNYTSGSTDPKHVPSYETWCSECSAYYPCRTVQACESAGTSDADH